jgi:hypothetical protein
MDKSKIAVALRFFESNPDKVEVSLKRLSAFLDEAIQYPNTYVAVNVDADKSDAVTFIRDVYPSVNVFGVSPWGKFTAPMTELTREALKGGAEVLVSASAEFPPKTGYVRALLEHLDEHTLQVGARFPEHLFGPGTHRDTGAGFPWNTFCLWALRRLAILGFPLGADSPSDETQAGVEEVLTVAAHQVLAVATGFEARVKLVTVPHFYGEWNQDGWDEARKVAHAKKIASKASRPAHQLKEAGLPEPQVIHIA